MTYEGKCILNFSKFSVSVSGVWVFGFFFSRVIEFKGDFPGKTLAKFVD